MAGALRRARGRSYGAGGGGEGSGVSGAEPRAGGGARRSPAPLLFPALSGYATCVSPASPVWGAAHFAYGVRAAPPPFPHLPSFIPLRRWRTAGAAGCAVGGPVRRVRARGGAERGALPAAAILSADGRRKRRLRRGAARGEWRRRRLPPKPLPDPPPVVPGSFRGFSRFPGGLPGVGARPRSRARPA